MGNHDCSFCGSWRGFGPGAGAYICNTCVIRFYDALQGTAGSGIAFSRLSRAKELQEGAEAQAASFLARCIRVEDLLAECRATLEALCSKIRG